MSPLTSTFVIVLALSFAIFMVFLRPSSPSKCTRQRLTIIQDSLRSHAAGIDGDELEKAEPWGYSTHLEIFLERFRFAKKLKSLLVHANTNIGLGGAVLTSVGAGLGSGSLCYVFVQSTPVACAVMIGGSMLPFIVLRIKRARRVKAFNIALPDAIDLMARALLAGHSMGASIEMISEQSPEPLACEFVQVFQQQRLGLHFRDALLQMGDRVPSRDLQFLVTAILVQKETGGDLTEILARASYVIRERVRIEGEVNTRTAQGRLTGWILGSLPVIMLAIINIVSPGYSNILFHDPTGRELLYTGAALILIGAAIIRKIVNVQV
jgi:tight adherence protein B